MNALQQVIETMSKKVRQAPLINIPDNGTYPVVVEIALRVLEQAVIEKDDQIARMVAAVLLPLRNVLRERPIDSISSAEQAIYLCAAGLKICGVAHPEFDAAILELDSLLPEDQRRRACDWANAECT
jgi:hypothetical protein